MNGLSAPRCVRVARVPLVFAVLIAALLVGWLTAPPAHAGEIKSFDPRFVNGRCQSSPLDGDCYHYAGRYSTHKRCVNKMAAIIGVNPNTDKGKFYLSLSHYMCHPTPPSGSYYLYVYQSSPPCKVGLPFSKCPKG